MVPLRGSTDRYSWVRTWGPVKKFTRDGNGNLSLVSKAQTNFAAGTMGTTTFVTADGSTNGIVWAIDHTSPIRTASPKPAVLHAYDALDLSHELWNSSQNGADVPGLAIKFTTPIAANGKVYIGTGADASTGEVDVYGLLPHSR